MDWLDTADSLVWLSGVWLLIVIGIAMVGTMPKASARRATSRPMAPSPTMPRVAPNTSRPRSLAGSTAVQARFLVARIDRDRLLEGLQGLLEFEVSLLEPIHDGLEALDRFGQ